MIATPDGLRTVCWDLPCEPSIVGKARSMVRGTCRSWGVPPQLADDLVLVVSELLGNAVVYGRPPVRLSLWATTEELCVRVTDHGPEDPRRLDLSPEAIHGRGLAIVEALSDRWGVVHSADETGTGKTVWAAWQWCGERSGAPLGS
ncbi:ATP-binding protein [Sphaerisporangium perillae]|uniref:ATP-binding protein n=1 Tax=Sphaerisporangium perillae TaxID=2935860 RepID=UPI00200E23D5|nr:ATP-binding protein [Sphaerisporangium perillae]